MLIAITLGTFTHLAGYAPWSPHMNAWSGDPVPEHLLRGTTALQRQGALVFQAKQCRNCHALGDSGGERGPGLDRVAVRLTQDQLIRQVIQGGGNMPAYGKNLSPAETTALVAFLGTLHPPNQPPAREAARDVVRGAGADTRASARNDPRLCRPGAWVHAWMASLPRRHAQAVGAWRAAGFLLGLVLIWIAVASPLASGDAHSLTVHMVQHLVSCRLRLP
jgi:mono/diheme cytochrome c family protein